MDSRLQVGPPWARMGLYIRDERLLPGVNYLFNNVEDRDYDNEGIINIDVLGNGDLGKVINEIPKIKGTGHKLIGGKYCAHENDWAGYYDFSTGCGSVAISEKNFAGLDTYLRQIAIYSAFENGYLPLHSVAFEYRGKTYICPGESDSGKSTIAGFIGGEASVYSDEINVIGGEPARVWSLPFRGTSGNGISSGGGAATAILIHRKAIAASVAKVNVSGALREIEKSVIVPAFRDLTIKNKAFQLLTGILDTIGVYIVNFPRDGRAFLKTVSSIGG
ncbi:MAG: hypothetical protein GY771_14850 [bacterium]|nr:hypothetical protein [bacterium]